jgi:acyl-CoA synthetase (AMP-forming)/AMP-acid ligase II
MSPDGAKLLPAVRVADCFAPVLAVEPGREALVARSGRWTYAELDSECAKAAQVWRDLGVRAGDRVAACLPNDADIVFAFHGAMRLGAIWVGINAHLAPPEKAYLLSDSGTSVLLCDEATATSLAPHRADLPDVREILALQRWQQLLAAATPATDLSAVDPDAPAGLGYTSGTTGRPKGAVHSQRNLLLPGAVLAASRGWGPDLRKGDCLPLTILNMQVLTTLTTSAAGGTAVIMDQIYASGVADWIGREAVTVWNGPPALLHSLVTDDGIAPVALQSLREAWSGGSALPEVLRQRFRSKFGVPVIGTYGLTEAPTVVAIDPPDGCFAEGASGQVLPHLQVTIDGTGQSEPGDICVSAVQTGPYAGLYRPPLGYWQRPEASAALAPGGVLRTGDIGFVDDDGWLHIVDRRNLVIMRGGANVYPAEVERVHDALPGVAASVVVGLPDERLGERVAAAVVLDEGAEMSLAEMTDRCRQELAKYKVPERIVVLPTVPRNAMGKIDRTAVRGLVQGDD